MKWFPEIENRRSRRSFDINRSIESHKLSALEKVCKQFVPFAGARSCLIAEPEHDIFKGLVGGYGKIQDAPAYIAFIGNMDRVSVQEEVGYTGEGIILEATALGLDTCWVGGFFNPEKVGKQIDIASNERILAITPIGYAREFETFQEKLFSGFGLNHRRIHLEKLISGIPQDKLSEWMMESIKAARLAPSAINRQPWGFHTESHCVSIYVRTSGPEYTVSKRLDCGIAMMHIELGALVHEIQGSWDFLTPPNVAKFCENGHTKEVCS